MTFQKNNSPFRQVRRPQPRRGHQSADESGPQAQKETPQRRKNE